MSSSCTSACYYDNLQALRALNNNPNYSTTINPSTGTGGPLNITVSFAIVKLLELSNSGAISIVAALTFAWRDPNLGWNLSSYNNLKMIEVPPSNVWTPTLILLNGVSESLRIELDNSSIAAVSYIGGVLLSIAGQLKATCSMDLSMFPFDQQQCTFQIIGYDLRQTYESTYFNFLPTASKTATYMFTSGGEFTLNSVNLTSGMSSDAASNTFSYFNITLSLTRNPNYYINNVAIPAILLLVAAGLVFFIPSDNGAKLGMACSLMVSLYVLQQAVGRMLPATKTTPLLAIGMIIELWLGCYSLFCAVLTVSIRSVQPALSPCCLKLVKKLDFLLCSPRNKNKVVNTNVGNSFLTELKNDIDSKIKDFVALLLDRADPASAAVAILLQTHLANEEKQERAEQQRKEAAEHARHWKVMDVIINMSLFTIYAVAGITCSVIYLFGK